MTKMNLEEGWIGSLKNQQISYFKQTIFMHKSNQIISFNKINKHKQSAHQTKILFITQSVVVQGAIGCACQLSIG